MPEHKGLPVAGYRSQNDDAVSIVNTMKWREEKILRALDELLGDPAIDQRWLQIGRTGIETAFMAINRSVFKPSRLTGDI